MVDQMASIERSQATMIKLASNGTETRPVPARVLFLLPKINRLSTQEQ